MRVNRKITAPRVRVIGENGEQLGVFALYEALNMADAASVDLVEIVPTATPPVCKLIDFGKFRYEQTKREKESRKSQHQIKVKEVKVKPNIGTHDLETKIRQAKGFLLEGDKVKVTCTFRGREMMHTEIGEKVVATFCKSLEEISTVETPAKQLGKMLTLILAPGGRRRRKLRKTQAKKLY